VKHTLFIFSIYFFFPLVTFGQELHATKIDSLKHIANSKGVLDTVKAEALIDIAFLYRNISVDSAKYYSVKSLGFSKSIGYKKGEAQALRNIGLSYLRSGKYDTAIAIVKSAAIVAQKNTIRSSLADCYNTLGTAYFRLLAYDSATYYYLASAEIFKELGQSVNVAGAYLNIGSIYQNKGNVVAALRNFQESLLVFEKLNNQQGIAAASYNLSGIFSSQGDFSKAVLYLARTAEIDSASKNLQGFAESLGQLGGFYAALENIDSAIYCYQRSIAIAQEIGTNCSVINPASELGELYLNMNLLDSAYFYLQFATSRAESCQTPKEQVTSNINLSKYYTQIGQEEVAIEKLKQAYAIASINQLANNLATASQFLYKNYKLLNKEALALRYLEEFDSLERNLFNAEKTRKIAQLEAEYVIAKERQKYTYEQDLRELSYQEQLATEQKQNIYFITLAIIFLVIVLVLWRLYHQKSKYNILLSDQNLQIKNQSRLLENKARLLEEQGAKIKTSNQHLLQLNKEKNTIIGIVAHDLKNPLNQIQGIAAIIKLEKYEKTSVEANLEVIEDAANRSIKFIDRILDISAAENKKILVLTTVVRLDKLLGSIIDTFKISALSKDIELIGYNNATITLETDPVLLREVIENLISNALKFSPIKSKVEVRLVSKDTHHEITISDQGPGINQDDQSKMFDEYQILSASPTNNEKSSGLGLAIVRRNIEALGFTIAATNRKAKGASFSIQIPIDKQ
jgi:signal transduction histidine kinase